MLLSQNYKKQVIVTTDTGVLASSTFVFPKIVTNYVKKQIAPVNFPRWIFKKKTNVITTAKIYPVKVVEVVVKTAGDEYPIKELKEYYRFPKKSLARVVTQNNMSTTVVFKPTVNTVVIEHPLASFRTITNEVTTYIDTDTTRIPVTYYNATGTFWSTG
jgi:hypothetical protein